MAIRARRGGLDMDAMDADAKERLLLLWAELEVDGRQSLLDFAEFLARGRSLGKRDEEAAQKPSGASIARLDGETGNAERPDGSGEFVFLANSASRQYHWVIRRVVLDDGHIGDGNIDGGHTDDAHTGGGQRVGGQADGGQQGKETVRPRRGRPRRGSGPAPSGTQPD